FGIAKLLDPRTALPETPAAARPIVSKDDTTLPAEPPAALPKAASTPGDTQNTMPFIDPGARPAEDLEQEGTANIDASLTKPGAVMGTPLYMAPEVWRGEAATRRSDVYGLGGVLYELASGSPPHTGHALMDISRAAQQDDAAPVAS